MQEWLDRLYRGGLAAAAPRSARETARLREARRILLSRWREVTEAARWGGVTLGTGRYPEVAQLLPDRPPGAKTCRVCDGSGYIRRDITGRGVVCPECGGLGWKSP